jgi:hypothetical protein
MRGASLRGMDSCSFITVRALRRVRLWVSFATGGDGGAARALPSRGNVLTVLT